MTTTRNEELLAWALAQQLLPHDLPVQFGMAQAQPGWASWDLGEMQRQEPSADPLAPGWPVYSAPVEMRVKLAEPPHRAVGRWRGVIEISLLGATVQCRPGVSPAEQRANLDGLGEMLGSTLDHCVLVLPEK
ncbi:hypothetical protein LCGC14_1555090 [marine sediment metagenome]|uniref:Uncharacterized protein n=1 Tax=marine sediment metagenome TaxID=412755 RepID=A0A0F9IP59_9ZZZZ